MNKDYRTSHLGKQKAQSYHQQFKKNPYRAMVWDLEQQALMKILSRLANTGPRKHLDFACGTGRIIGFISQNGWNSTGIDLSKDMLDIAKTTYPECKFVEADITREDVLEDDRFDLITAFRFFPNAQPELRASAISSLASKLAKDGILVFNNHKNADSLTYKLGKFIRSKQHAFSESEVLNLLGSVNLEIVESHHIGVLPMTEKYRILPISVIRRFEMFFSRFEKFKSSATNIIYVCRLSA